MTDRQLTDVISAFKQYLAEFGAGTAAFHRFLQLKLSHSENVAGEARDLSADLQWGPAEQNNAEALGLLHDTGRFEQFTKYHTFADNDSVDHGELGWRIVRERGFLEPLSAAEQRPILDGIRYHNNRFMPSPLPPRSLSYLQLIRDADKLDIYRVVLEALDQNGFRDLRQMLPNIRLDRSVTDAFVDEMHQGKAGTLSHVKSLGDFLLLQMMWINDFNYQAALEKALGREILPRLAQHIKDHPEVKRILKQANQMTGRHTRNEQ